MDSVLVQTVDSLLTEKLPTKSSMSSAEWTICYPQATQELSQNGSNMYRFTLPKYPHGYLCATKGGLNPFFQFTLTGIPQSAANDATTMRLEPWGVFRQIKVYFNGVLVTDLQYAHHVYAEWLKKKDINNLNTDGANFGFPDNYWGELPPLAVNAGHKFTLPLMDNFSVFSKNHALPLSSIEITMEVILNDFKYFSTGALAGGGGVALSTVNMSNLSLMLPICHIDPEVDQAIQMKLEQGDLSEADMFLMPIENVRCDAQSYSFSANTTKSFIWNTVSSSVRFLEAIISPDNNGTQVYKTSRTQNPAVLNYIYRVDGKNVTQTNITTQDGGYDQAYQLRNDLTSAYNYINNEQAYQMGSVKKSVFNNQDLTNPALTEGLRSSFSACAILDTVSKDNVVSGQKIINNLQLEIQTGAGAGVPLNNANVYLIQHSNAVLAFSKSKAKLLL